MHPPSLSNTELAEDEVEDVIRRGGSGYCVKRSKGVVKIEQEHLVRDSASYRMARRLQPNQ